MVRFVVRVTSATVVPVMMEVIDTSAVPAPPMSRRRAALHRRHAINLCCAQSVAAMVEEIARQLRGLGFDASVSCGAQARAALLGGEAFTQRPTIHVVCVQGSLQERVLKPLRQALATHGGEGQHLFVAVLDLSTPLTMVGHIRRFAEALERTPAAPIRVRDHLGERRRWREHFGHRELAERPTKSHPIVADRLASGPRPIVRAGGERKGARTIATRSRPVRIVPTAKNRQVTAPQAVVDLQPPRVSAKGPSARTEITPPSIGPRPGAPARRVPPPSLRFPPPPGLAATPATEPAPVATHIGAVADAIVAAHEAVKAQVAETKERVEAAVLADSAPHPQAKPARTFVPPPRPRADTSPPWIDAPPSGLRDDVQLRARPSIAIEIDARARPGVAIEIDARDRKPVGGETEAPSRPEVGLASEPAARAAAPVAEPAASRTEPAMTRTAVAAPHLDAPAWPSASPRPALAHGASTEIAPPRRLWPFAAALLLVGVGALAWISREAWLPAAASTPELAAAPAHAPDDPATPEPAALADARAAAKRRTADAPAADAEPADAEPTDAEPADAEPEPEPAIARAPVSAGAGASEAALREAVARHRLLEVDDLYVTRKRGSATSWAEARSRCNAFTFDGIDGWRLPWRRELKLIGVSTRMEAGTYWSHSGADGHPGSAWAWDTASRELEVTPKRETTAEVVCVKPR